MRISRQSMIIGWLLFVILPCVLAGLAADRGIRLLRTGEARNATLALAQEARRIIADAVPETTIERDFRHGTLGAGLTLLQNFPDSSSLSNDALTGRLTGQLPEDLPDFLNGNASATPSQITSWHRLFVVHFDPEAFRRQPGKAIQVRWGREIAWLVWDRPRDRRRHAGQLSDKSQGSDYNRVPAPDSAGRNTARRDVNINTAPEKRQSVEPSGCRIWLVAVRSNAMLLKRSLDGRLAEMAITGAAGVVDRAARHWWGRSGFPEDRVRDSLRQRAATGTRKKSGDVYDVRDGRVSHLERLRGGLILYLDRELSSLSRTVDEGRFVWWSFVAVIMGTFLFIRMCDSAVDAPLSLRLWALFSYVIGLPLLGVVVLGLGIHVDRDGIRQRELVQMARHELMAFDDGFREEEGRMTRWFLKLSQHPALDAGRKDLFENAIEPLFKDGMIDRVEARDWNNQSWLKRDAGDMDRGMDRITELISEYAVSEKAYRDAGVEPPKKSSLLMMMQEILEAPLFGFSELLRKPGIVQSFRSGQSMFYWFWIHARNRTHPIAFFTLGRSSEAAMQAYLSRNIVHNRQIRLVAKSRETGKWFGILRPDRVITAVADAIGRSGEEQLGMTIRGGVEYLVVGIPGMRLTGVDLVGLVPLSKAREEADLFIGRIGWGIGLSLLIGFLCVGLLSEGLLRPLSDLTEGIAALRRRETEHRIPVRGGDELAKMAYAFNTMLENLVEIDMARDVQETLIVSSPKVPVGYETAVKVMLNPHLGGDYTDSAILSDGCYVFLTGTVPTQGIGGALVAAMVKAAVAMQSSEQSGSDCFFAGVNRTLYEVARPHSLQCVFGLLEPNTHRLSLASADHGFPLLWRNSEKTVSVVGKPGRALGVSPDLNVGFQELTFAEGDLLFLFTVGVIRAIGAAGEQFGFDRMRKIVADKAAEGPDAVVNAMGKALNEHLAGRSSIDDLTVFALRRKPAEVVK
ncbi:MAG: SpoIIE family protein phosphatase [Candidatus Riflebacteria bacterium]|nr:SpoIIE family protein phosphatase [Candidatus Riflebacteria bacterium]